MSIAGWAEGLAATCLGLLAVLGLACAPTESEIADLPFHRGQNALELGRYDWARLYFEQDLAANPDRAASRRGLGLAWLSGHSGSLTHGISALSAYLESTPGDLEARLHLARTLIRYSEMEKAMGVLQPALHEADGAALMAELLEEADPDGAQRWLEKAFSLQPTQVPSLLLAGRLALRRQDCDAAHRHASAAVAADPLDAEAHYLLGRVKRCLGDAPASAKALETYRQLSRLRDAGGQRLLPAGEELDILRTALPADRYTAGSLNLRLASLELMTGGAGAGDAVRLVLDDEKASGADLLEIGRVAQTSSRTDLARRLFERALELEPGLKAARARWARLERDLGDNAIAHELVREGLAQSAHYAPYHFVDGLLKLDAADQDAATAAFERALELTPWLADYRLALADVYRAAGRGGEIDKLLESAPAEDPRFDAYRTGSLRK